MHKTTIFPCEYHPLHFPQKLLRGVLCAQREPLLTSASPLAHLTLVPISSAPHPVVLSRASHMRSTGERQLSTSWTRFPAGGHHLPQLCVAAPATPSSPSSLCSVTGAASGQVLGHAIFSAHCLPEQCSLLPMLGPWSRGDDPNSCSF